MSTESTLTPLVAEVHWNLVDGILFLASSPFVTGQILHIDGGQIAGHQRGPARRPPGGLAEGAAHPSGGPNEAPG